MVGVLYLYGRKHFIRISLQLVRQFLRGWETNFTLRVAYRRRSFDGGNGKALIYARGRISHGALRGAAYRWASCLAGPTRWTVICAGMPPVARWKPIPGGNANNEGATAAEKTPAIPPASNTFRDFRRQSNVSEGSWCTLPCLGVSGAIRNIENASERFALDLFASLCELCKRVIGFHDSLTCAHVF